LLSFNQARTEIPVVSIILATPPDLVIVVS